MLQPFLDLITGFTKTIPATMSTPPYIFVNGVKVDANGYVVTNNG